MSVIGINIKKIRGVKGLNQTDFANLFGLTRANIGSYEELRAEPKIETIIKIATYYKLPIDKLVRKELTVNEISNFDVFSKLQLSTKSTSKEELSYVSKSSLENFPKNKSNKTFLDGLNKVVFPFGDQSIQRMALYNEGNDLYFNNEGFIHGDILFLERINKIESSILGVVIDETKIYKGVLNKIGTKIVIRPLNLNKEKIQLTETKKVDVWKIIGRYTSEVITRLVVNRGLID